MLIVSQVPILSSAPKPLLYGFLKEGCSSISVWPVRISIIKHLISFMFPRRAIKFISVWISDSISMFCTTSRCTARLDGQLNMIPYHFISFLYCLIKNGPNISNPTYVTSGSVLILSAGKSAIFCSPTFPRTYQHLTYLAMKAQAIQFAFTIQYPDDLILFKVKSLPLWPTDWWHDLTSKLVTILWLDSEIGCVYSVLRFDLIVESIPLPVIWCSTKCISARTTGRSPIFKSGSFIFWWFQSSGIVARTSLLLLINFMSLKPYFWHISLTVLTNFIAISLFSMVWTYHQCKSPFVIFVQLQSQILLRHQLMFVSMQNYNNVVKM